MSPVISVFDGPRRKAVALLPERRWDRFVLFGSMALGGILVAVVGYNLHLDFWHRDQAAKVRRGMRGSEVDSLFRKGPDCLIATPTLEARYYVSPKWPSPGWVAQCGDAKLAVASGKPLPDGPYCAAFVTLDSTGVTGVKLLGEGWLLNPPTQLPEALGDPSCC
jgi:hypothetical protein